MGNMCPTSPPQPSTVTTLYELDNQLSSTLGGDCKCRICGLVVVLSGAVCVRAEARFVALGDTSALDSNAPPWLHDAPGNFRMVAHSLSLLWQSPFQVSTYDATCLPIFAD
jgi:hypothetical protein